MSDEILNICVVNYKTPSMTVECLESVLAVTPSQALVTVIDSHSEDGSFEKIRKWVSMTGVSGRVSVLQLPANKGFSHAYNAAIQAKKADFYLLLNSDTIVQPGAIQALLDAARRKPSAGLFGPRLEWRDGRAQESCFRDFTALGEFVSVAATGVVSAMFRNHVVAIPVQDIEFEPQWLSFAAVMIRDEVIGKIGLLDEEFFLYFEDSEYCYRARSGGWTPLYVPAARVVHLRGGSSDLKSKTAATQRLPRYYYASRARYFRLRHGTLGPVAANLGWYAGRTISFVREVVERRKPRVPASAWKDIWTGCFGLKK